MSDPDLPPLPPEVAALLAAERHAPAPPAPLQDAVLSRVLHSVGVAGPTAVAVTGAGHAGLLGAKVLVVVGAVAVLGAGGLALRRSTPVPSTPSRAAPAVPFVVPRSAPSTPVTVTASVAVTTTVADAGAHRVRPAPWTDGQLAREQSLLDEAQAALAGHQPAAAASALRRHREQFAQGRLAEEREALWIRTLALQGRVAEAHERAARFQQLHPDSIFLPVVRSALESIP